MRTLLFWLTVLPLVSAHAAPYKSCPDDAVKQRARSKELQAIVAADQADRKAVPMPPDMPFRDRARRERVGQIFGEGCFTTAADYAAAALVYQHGDRPDHFFQTFLWAKRATELGDPLQKRLSALGVDRYLVNLGYQQLFASQASRGLNEPCWCLEPVEKSFPESMRLEYMGTSLAEQLTWVNSLNEGTKCPAAKYCAHNLEPTPRGTVPGLW